MTTTDLQQLLDGKQIELLHDERHHVLLTRDTCPCDKQSDWSCNVCDGGLAVCSRCGKAEVELDEPCGQRPQAGLRLLVTDAAANSVGVLAIEPVQLALPDELALDYSWQWVREPAMPRFDECDYSIRTRVERDFPADMLPF